MINSDGWDRLSNTCANENDPLRKPLRYRDIAADCDGVARIWKSRPPA